MSRAHAVTALFAAMLMLAACTPERVLQWQPRTYTVQPGDTLYSIAFRHRVDWRDLADWNRIDGPGYLIRPGQTLVLRAPAGATVAERRDTRDTTPAPRPAPTPRPAPLPAPPADDLSWHWPADGELVSRFNDGGTLGKGIGIAGRKGQDIRAASAGRIVYTGSGLVGYGRLIIVKHNSHMLSAYAHNDEILVREGDEVRAGQRIATMGDAPGRRAMLHFEIRVDGQAVDPLHHLPAR